MPGVGGQQAQKIEAFRVQACPFPRALPAHAAAHQEAHTQDAEMVSDKVEKAGLVAGGDEREVEAVGLARFRVQALRAGTPVAAPEHIDADDEVFTRVNRKAFPDEPRPPVFRIAVGGEGVADPYYVVSGGVQLPVGIVGRRQGWQGFAGFQGEGVGDVEVFCQDR